MNTETVRPSKTSLKIDPSLADPGLFVIEKISGAGHDRYKVDGSGEDPSLYSSEDDAEYVLSQMSAGSARKRHVRLATDAEKAVGRLVKPKRTAGRVTCLVEIFEDLDQRKFAISSRAEDESEFIVEFAAAFSRMSSTDPGGTSTRMRELLPLVVDLCCKYRGYKCERVQARMLLIAGDLEVPSVKLPAEQPEPVEA